MESELSRVKKMRRSTILLAMNVLPLYSYKKNLILVFLQRLVLSRRTDDYILLLAHRDRMIAPFLPCQLPIRFSYKFGITDSSCSGL